MIQTSSKSPGVASSTTKQRKYGVACANCGAEVNPATPFSDWLRGLPGALSSVNISNQNLDFIWHNYNENWLITIEEKRYGGRSTGAQEDTHGIVAQMLKKGSGQRIKTKWRGWKIVEYRGHYVVVFETTTPDDSDWIEINGEKTDRTGLLELLICGRLTERTA